MKIKCWMLMLGFLIPMALHAERLPAIDTDWSAQTIDEMRAALEGYNEEREPRNIPALAAAVDELRIRVQRGDGPQAIELLVQYLKAKSVAEYLSAKDAGELKPGTPELEYVNQLPAAREAAKALDRGLLEHHRDPDMLRAVLQSDLGISEKRRVELIERLLEVDPKANGYRAILARAYAREGNMASLRKEVNLLLQNLDSNQASDLETLNELPFWFEIGDPPCQELAHRFTQQLSVGSPLIEALAQQVQDESSDDGRKVANGDGASLRAREEWVQAVQAELNQSACGKSP